MAVFYFIELRYDKLFYSKYIYTGWPIQLPHDTAKRVKTWEYTKIHVHIVYDKKRVSNLKSLGI